MHDVAYEFACAVAMRSSNERERPYNMFCANCDAQDTKNDEN